MLNQLRHLLRIYWLPLLMAIMVRLVGLATNPPGLYWEEVALGYDGYSIWQTGADHHGNRWPIVAFESFGDWKPSLYFYLVSPFVGLFGLNAWAVRLPSALAGISMVIGIGFLAHRLSTYFSITKSSQFCWWAMMMAAINPWAIQFSRAAWEVNLASSLLLWAVVLMLTFWHTLKYSHLGGSALLFILSMYAYHATRVIAPILGLSGILIALMLNRQKIINTFSHHKVGVARWAIVLLLAILPILSQLSSPRMTQRFAETTILQDIQPIVESNRYQELSNHHWLSRILFHRFTLIGKQLFHNYSSHFTLDFLFISGDGNPRHSTGFTGLFYLVDAVWLIIGLYHLIRHKNQPRLWLLLIWLMVGVLPAAITQPTPHALRILPTLPVWIMILTCGWLRFWSAIEAWSFLMGWRWLKPILQSIVAGVYIALIGGYFNFYWFIYPKLSATEWQVGYPKLIEEIENTKNSNPDQLIYVSRQWGRPAMYYWFYTATEPSLVQAQDDQVLKDQGEFLEFENLRFDSSQFKSNQDIMVHIKSFN